MILTTKCQGLDSVNLVRCPLLFFTWPFISRRNRKTSGATLTSLRNLDSQQPMDAKHTSKMTSKDNVAHGQRTGHGWPYCPRPKSNQKHQTISFLESRYIRKSKTTTTKEYIHIHTHSHIIWPRTKTRVKKWIYQKLYDISIRISSSCVTWQTWYMESHSVWYNYNFF